MEYLPLILGPGSAGRRGLLVIENLSSESLSLLPFSSRPRISGLKGGEILSLWAQWIATSRQGIIVEPKSTWVMNPDDLGKLPAFHGHTWIGIFFSDARSAPEGLPATVLPDNFTGRFRVRYCLSRLPEYQVAVPQMYRQNLVTLLSEEVDASGKKTIALAAGDLSARNEITSKELR